MLEITSIAKSGKLNNVAEHARALEQAHAEFRLFLLVRPTDIRL